MPHHAGFACGAFWVSRFPYSLPKLTRWQSYTANYNNAPIYSFNITSFAPNGDVLAANDSVNGNWNYSYDQFNRLVCADLASNGACAMPPSGTPTYTYVYDRFGNRWQQNGPHAFIASFTGNSSTNNNRMDGYSYDAAGNLMNDGTHQYTYDAENRMISVDNGNTATYAYDPDGNRVQKISKTGGGLGDPVGTFQFLYDQSGRMIQRFEGALWQGNVFVGARHLVTGTDGDTFFSHSDWLGTERVRNTYSAPTLLLTCASLPFGDGFSCNGGDWSPLHFTGKEHDYESGLDYFGARFDASSFGRFMSPDAFYKDSHVGDPQSWNEYAYARNNPLRYVDPNGEKADVSTNCTTTNNQTTCNVNISASITVYATSGSNLTQDQLNAAASQIQSSIQNAWSGSFTQDGVTYNVSTQISVSVAGSEADAMKSGAQNVIGLSNGPADAAHNADSFVNSRSLFLAITGRGPDTGVFNINSLASGVAAHEFTHLLGVGDKSGSVLSNTNILLDPALPHSATAYDFRWGIREAINSVNLGRDMSSWGCHGWQCASVTPPATPHIYSRDTVAAPFLWWK